MTAVTPAEARALDALDVAACTDLLRELMSIPSVSGTPEECEIQHLLAKRSLALDLDVDLWSMDLAELTARPDFPGVESPRDEGWGLVATLPGAATEVGLVLQGHVDVVPPGDPGRWRDDPFEPTLRSGRIHGRGACDMKAGLAANLAAVSAVRRAGLRLERSLALHCVIGEEDGGLGAYATLDRGHVGEACVITEPTDGTLVTANAGALTFSLEVPGAATHASTAYEGSSAIDSYLALHQGLKDLERERNRSVSPLLAEYPVAYPISVGRLRAGDWSSSVPDLLVAEGRLGVALDEDPADARLALETRLLSLAERDPFLRDHPPRITWSGGQFASGACPPGHPLTRVVAGAHADVTPGGDHLRERGAPYGSDLRLYQAAGVPTLHYGPGEVRLAHGPDESVAVSDLVTVARALTLTILRTCGVRD